MTIASAATLTRRGFLASAGVAATAAWLAPGRLFAADAPTSAPEDILQKMRRQASTAKIDVQTLRGNISVLLGSGGNIAVLPGKDGKLLVDAGFSTSRPQISEALTSISADPITHLVNTHWHFDHTDGNEWLHTAGAAIIAHEKTREHLSTAVHSPDWDYTFEPLPEGARPATDFASAMKLHLNGATIALKYYEPAHTDGDISVDFVEADVLHAGDTWFNGHFPYIDYTTGGSINGMIRAAETNLARATAKTLIIPGHGPVGDKPQLVEYRDMLVAVRDKVAALKKAGKTVDEVVAAKPTATYDAKWGTSMIGPDMFAKLVYKGV